MLSSSFIPVYVNLMARGEEDEAERLAGAVAGLLAAATAVLVLAGMAGAPVLVAIITPGLSGGEHALAIRLVRILFPATGTLVLSAWCLGVLNSHHRFFLSYVAPVVMNGAVVAALIAFGGHSDEERLASWVSWGYLAGAVLQVAVQVPTALAVLGRFRPSLSASGRAVRTVLTNFAPALVGRGVVQLSAFLDTVYASYVGTRGLAALGYQQILYLLPNQPVRHGHLGQRAARDECGPGQRRDGGRPAACAPRRRAVAARLLRHSLRGRFLVPGRRGRRRLLPDRRPTRRRHPLSLAGPDRASTVGLLAATMGRLYGSAFYALKDTRTPLWFALVRLSLTAGLAWWSAVRMPGLFGVPRQVGLVGITATTGFAAWLEYALLRRALNARIGTTGLPVRTFARLWAAAIAGGIAGLLVKALLVRWRGAAPGLSEQWGGGFLPPPRLYAPLAALPILGGFGLVYLGIALATSPGGPRAALGVSANDAPHSSGREQHPCRFRRAAAIPTLSRKASFGLPRRVSRG